MRGMKPAIPDRLLPILTETEETPNVDLKKELTPFPAISGLRFDFHSSSEEQLYLFPHENIFV
jgi:hypothetical protein